MNNGKARAIFDNIENASESIEEKGEAIYIVMNMETHNSHTIHGSSDYMHPYGDPLEVRHHKEGQEE